MNRNKKCLACGRLESELSLDREYGCFIGGVKISARHRYVPKKSKATTNILNAKIG